MAQMPPGRGAGEPSGQPGGGEQLSEEQVRAYLAQLRQANVAEIVAQAFSMLASGAEVKLGRRDARLLIDMAAAIADLSGSQLDDRLKEQMDAAVSQLRLGQVDAEGQLAKLREEGRLPAEEAGDLPAEGAGAAETSGAPEAPAPGATGPAASQPPPKRPSAASRLWIPGR